MLKKDVGRDVALKCLEAIRDCPDISVGAVWMQTTERGPGFAVKKHALYDRLLIDLDSRLADDDVHAMITMDGEEKRFLESHRRLKLDTRHVIEDPAMHDSKRSQWVQMADLVAYTALISLNRHQHNEFGWEWYATHLKDSDVNGGIRELPDSPRDDAST